MKSASAGDRLASSPRKMPKFANAFGSGNGRNCFAVRHVQFPGEGAGVGGRQEKGGGHLEARWHRPDQFAGGEAAQDLGQVSNTLESFLDGSEVVSILVEQYITARCFALF
jgi:hypothetical protein